MYCFSAASGLKVNFDKNAFVPLSIQPHDLPRIEQILRCKQQSFPITYLGMPLTIRTPTRTDYMPLLDRLEKRLDGWRARFISKAGKLQLIKSVLSTTPTYFMSCFKLPKWLIMRIDIIRRQFLWTRSDNARAIHLMNWTKVCLPVNCGGVRVVDLHLQNMALLLRWLWRLYAMDRTLWASYANMIHGAQPVTDGPVILSKVGSFFWNSLLRLKPLFHNCAKFRIVSGRHISFWFDSWAGRPLVTTVTGPIAQKRISIYEAKGRYHQLLPAPLTADQDEAIRLLTSFTPQHGRDELLWNPSTSGSFSVSSIYKLLSSGGKILSATAHIWKIRVTPSMRLFFYLLINGRVLTHDVMERRNISYQPGCVMCVPNQTETAMHLFFLCPYARQIWSAISVASGFTITHKDSVQLTYLASVPHGRDQRRLWTIMFVTALWLLWRERNERIFRAKRTPPFVLLRAIQQEASLCTKYC